MSNISAAFSRSRNQVFSFCVQLAYTNGSCNPSINFSQRS